MTTDTTTRRWFCAEGRHVHHSASGADACSRRRSPVQWSRATSRRGGWTEAGHTARVAETERERWGR